jgi:hypothetical protein
MDEKNPAKRNRILAYLKTMQEKGIVYVATDEEAAIANEIEKRLEVIDESGLAALAKVLGLGNADRGTAITGGDEDPLQARIRELKAANISKEATRRILIDEGLIDG